MKKIFLVVSMISVLFLTGCNKTVNNPNTDVNSDVLQNENVESGNVEKIVKKVDENKDIVYKVFERQINAEGTSPEFLLCELPYINIDSKEVEKINNKISSYIEDAKKIEDSINSVCPSYYASINDNVLTVALGSKPAVGMNFNGEVCFLLVDEVYNIDIYTGELLDTEDVLRITNNISSNDINLKEIYNEMFSNGDIPAELKDEFRENGKLPLGYDGANWINEAYKEYLEYYANKTIEDIPWFIDDNKNIIAEMYWYTPFGATDGSVIIEQVNITEIIKGKGNDYYIIEDSDKKVIEESEYTKGYYPEFYDISNNELNIAYNEIFARHGHDFQSKDLKEHFNNMLWYNPIEGKKVSLEELNDVEKENVRIIKEEIDARKMLLEKYKTVE